MTKISAGGYDLNRWLHGGYDTDIITTFYGPAGAGKTNFALQVAVSQAKKGHKVIYIDTEGGFSVERVRQLCYGENYELVLGNILLLKPTSFAEQRKVFDDLNKHLKNQVSLIIVDSMTMLYRLDFSSARQKSNEEMQHVNGELARQMRILAEISRKHEIPVIVTNQVYNWDSDLRMVAGDVMKYWSKCLIELKNEGGRRVAFLRKHRSLPESSLAFYISNEGIKKRGWI